ncbi:unnamed protein product [Dovyalis caffra]|uniref:Uncharacterized protein n=1 Tax=Dovyalis caffra TaxID=77055 RepID=A0AAV1S104_9ROSI|nr:unnamed protein product [Dovyalis caffra]
MGGERKKILMGLMVAMILGFAVYFRLWTIDYAISSDDTELIRRQFDLANREALDESAEWRIKYDEEVERAAKCDKQLIELMELSKLTHFCYMISMIPYVAGGIGAMIFMLGA